MRWRSVRSINLSLNLGSSDFAQSLQANNYAVEACIEGSWLVFRIQEEEDSEVHEYAVPAQAVSYVSFYPQEP